MREPGRPIKVPGSGEVGLNPVLPRTPEVVAMSTGLTKPEIKGDLPAAPTGATPGATPGGTTADTTPPGTPGAGSNPPAEDTPAAAGTTVTNSSPFTAPTGTPTSTEYPTVIPGKVYTWAEIEAFQQAMSAADMATMKDRQQTMYRAGRYSEKPSGDGWISLPLATGGYYEYRADPVWQGHWSTSPNAGGSTGAGTGTGGAGDLGSGAGDAGNGSGLGAGDYQGGAPDLTPLLEEWKKAALEQSNGTIDFAVQQAILDLERALEDSKAQYKEQAEGVARDEMQALDNSALYAEMRGDKGGIGHSQYNEIQAAAAQNRLAVQQAQTKLSTDTARQIADLRAQGEFEKADKLLEITQTYLSQLMSLEQWQAEFGLSQKQFEASLMQWQKEYDMAVDQFKFEKETWQQEFDYRANSDDVDLILSMMSAGMALTDDQLNKIGLSRTAYDEWRKTQQLTGAAGDVEGGTVVNVNDWSKYTEAQILNALQAGNYSADDETALRTAMLTRGVSADVVDDIIDMYKAGTWNGRVDGKALYEGMTKSQREGVWTAMQGGYDEIIPYLNSLWPDDSAFAAGVAYLRSINPAFRELLNANGFY